MSEVTNIVEELHQIQYSDSAWHGPGLYKILSGVNASKALARSLPDYRSIWELVLHISKWEEVFCIRLNGEAMVEPVEGDWPAVTDTSDSAWQNALKFLDQAHDRLIEIITRLRDDDLNKTVAGKDYTVAYMLHGIVRHHVYHAGQIALLKRFGASI